MDQLTPLQNSVLSLVKQYVARQSLVLEAMRELRPDFMARREHRIDSMTQEQWIELVFKFRHSQIGFWGKEQEWEYYFHGGGECRLINKVTGEYIHWGAADLNTFNLDWFVPYLQWRLKQSHDNDVKIVHAALQPTEIIKDDKYEQQRTDQYLEMRKQILPIIEQLCEKELLIGNAQRLYFTVVNNAL
jgi:hypothetical protein